MRAEDDKITEKDFVVTRLGLTLDEEAISQFIDKVNVPVVLVVQVPQEQVVAKTVEIPRSLLCEKIVAIPEVAVGSKSFRFLRVTPTFRRRQP